MTMIFQIGMHKTRLVLLTKRYMPNVEEDSFNHIQNEQCFPSRYKPTYHQCI
uniref:Uncharacterized protein MANES_01G103400 n=1 Tax=Rhizophora mucronata TaxID=61149 RepID=A0A2P2KSS5_RHIMU